MIERIAIDKGKVSTVVSLASLQAMPGQMAMWFGLTPKDSVVLFHTYAASEIYSLVWPNP